MGTLILNNVQKAIANMYTLHSKVHNIQYPLRLDWISQSSHCSNLIRL